MQNQLNLRFGPAPQNKGQAVGIAFVASSMMQPDLSVSAFDTYKFAKENAPQLRDYIFHPNSFSTEFKLRHVYGGTSLFSQVPPASGGWSIYDSSKTVDLTDNNYSLPFVNSPIKSLGIRQTRSSSWGLEVTSGVIFRSYTIPSYEQSDAWFLSDALSGILEVGSTCVLVYTVPECFYGTLEDSVEGVYPGSGFKLRAVVETAHAAGPNRITFSDSLHSLKRITVNGIDKYTGNFTEDSSATGVIKEVNRASKYIDVRFSLAPGDEIELEYTIFAQKFTYLGYRDRNNVYYPFDANPEYGHVIGDSRYGAIRSSADCLLEQVTVYAIPSAVGVYSIVKGSPDEIVLTFYSAYDYGETHFIRHCVGENIEDIVPRVSEGPSNTYGFSVFGRNYYDEAGVPKRDIFSTRYPSMLPLSRVLLKAPASVNSIKVADARIRGGGIPEDFDFDLLVSEPNALNTLRGYFDLGNWDGKAAQVGGAITIRVNKSVLVAEGGKYTVEDVKEIVENRIPPGVYYKLEFV